MSRHSPNQTPTDLLASRRRAVFDQLGGGVLVLPSAPIQYTSRDTERRYVPDRELFYLTGLDEPGCVAVLLGGDDPRLVVFALPRDDEAELWAGPRLGLEGVADVSGANDVHDLNDLTTLLPGLLASADRIHYRFGRSDTVERMVLGALTGARSRGQRAGTGPRGVLDPGEILDELRLVKSAHELDVIREACRITEQGHRAAAGAIEEGAGEWAVEAELERAFRREGSTGPGFDSIVGSGQNACVLHYVANDSAIPAGGLVLVDAGAEYGLYHGDVTRTFPANGRFTPEQREIYDLVDEARQVAIDRIRPGGTLDEVHEAATGVLIQGLLDLGVLEDEVGHRDYFPHRTSHWLGLDVHDPGDYAREGQSRTLVAGMVLTVEPGLYFRPALSAATAARWAGIGVRIEDDVAVTASGAEVLTAGLPTAASAVEALVGS